MIRWVMLGLATALCVVLVACGGSDESREAIVTSPQPRTNDFDARIASRDDFLWLVRTSRSADGFATSVVEYDGSEWRPAEGRFPSTTDWPLSIVIPDGDGKPCISYSDPRGKSRVLCRSAESWRPIVPTEDFDEFQVRDLGVSGSDLITLYSRVGRESTIVRLAKKVGTKLEPMGDPILLRDNVLANLGQSLDSETAPGVDVAMENLDTGHRWVATLDEDGWSHTEALRRAAGPQVSGSLRTDMGIVLPVIPAPEEGGWKLDAFTHDRVWRRLDGTPLNVGVGDAQGAIDPVGGDGWFTWTQTDTSRVDRRGRAEIGVFAARLVEGGENVENPRELWKGKAVWPGPTQAVPYDNGAAFLYLRGSRRGTELRAEVRIEPSP